MNKDERQYLVETIRRLANGIEDGMINPDATRMHFKNKTANENLAGRPSIFFGYSVHGDVNIGEV